MFLVTSPDEHPVNVSFKTSDELFDQLSSKKRFMPAPYMARKKWIHIKDVGRLSKKEWIKLIDLAYQLIFSKLTKKLQKEITGK